MGLKREKDKLLENLKWESALDLDLIHKVLEVGWDNMTAQETGKIGGLVSKKIKIIKHTEQKDD